LGAYRLRLGLIAQCGCLTLLSHRPHPRDPAQLYGRAHLARAGDSSRAVRSPRCARLLPACLQAACPRHALDGRHSRKEDLPRGRAQEGVAAVP
jgi:hypothetical protein